MFIIPICLALTVCSMGEQGSNLIYTAIIGYFSKTGTWNFVQQFYLTFVSTACPGYSALLCEVACDYYYRSYNKKEKEFWRAASRIPEHEDPWLPYKSLIVHVLVPYVAVQLIREEMSIGIEDALDVYKRSMAFGCDFNSDCNDEEFDKIDTMLADHYKLDDPEPDDICDEVSLFIIDQICPQSLSFSRDL